MHDYRGEFEVHITVLAPDRPTLARFQQWCQSRECKCVWIVLSRGLHPNQPLATWRRHETTLPVVMAEAKRCAADLNAAALPVMRVKIETALVNEEVPVRDADAAAHDATTYFEHHVKLLRDTSAPSDGLLSACESHGAHLSRNAFRPVEAGREERFVTLRSYGVGRLTSDHQLQKLLAALNELGEEVIDCESEYCVFDSNLELDVGWLRQTT